jgi:hypothetical protein
MRIHALSRGEGRAPRPRENFCYAILVGPEHEQTDLATPASNCAAQWASRTLEAIVRSIRMWVVGRLACYMEQRDTALEMQTEIGMLACRIARIVVGLCECLAIGASRYCRPLHRCRRKEDLGCPYLWSYRGGIRWSQA